MSQIDRGLPKCERSVCKDGDGSDLSLSGSQVCLAFCPPSGLPCVLYFRGTFGALSVALIVS